MKAFFDHERLDIYQAARKFNREVARLLEEIPLNDKTHYYHIARGSATECAAVLDELVDYGLLPETRIEAPKGILGTVVAMLIGLIRSLENREGADIEVTPGS